MNSIRKIEYYNNYVKQLTRSLTNTDLLDVILYKETLETVVEEWLHLTSHCQSPALPKIGNQL